MKAARKATERTEPEPIIRPATKADVPLILEFIRELAVYEKLERDVTATEDIIAHNLFGPRAHAESLIAEVDGQAAGFAIFFHNFSTFLGKPGLYLEDLFVRPDYRSCGVGLCLLRELARVALARDCGRMEWWVLDWNKPAIDFYRKLGAQSMDDWTVQRLTRAEIEKLANT